MKELRFFVGFLFGGFALGLEGAELIHILLERAVDARFVEGDVEDVFGAAHEGGGFAEEDVGLGGAGIDLIFRVGVAEGEDAVFDGADAIEAPVAVGDEVGELEFEGAVWAEAGDDGVAKGVESAAIVVGHDGDLAGEAVEEAVEADFSFASSS